MVIVCMDWSIDFIDMHEAIRMSFLAVRDVVSF
jgi:hypothetical protein